MPAPEREPRLFLGRREVDHDPAWRCLVLVAAPLVGALVVLVVGPAATLAVIGEAIAVLAFLGESVRGKDVLALATDR
ncbi:hypothetical protein J2W15_003642 [Pseudarthrobacter sulfonivorans]|nr:hypothetical protein [Pseudarthrobacter sulfonivorans]